MSNIFNENAKLDTSQVSDRRGSGRGSAIAVGGGGVGLMVLVISMLLGVDPARLLEALRRSKICSPSLKVKRLGTRQHSPALLPRIATPGLMRTPARIAGLLALLTACKRTEHRAPAARCALP